MTTDQKKRRIFVTDFDGTISQTDFYQVVVKRFLTPEDLEPWKAYHAGESTHFEALAAIFGRLRASEQDILDCLVDMGVNANIATTIEKLRECGWQILIASAGCRWYIDHLLKHVTPPVVTYANEGHYDPQHGLVMTPPANGVHFDPAIGTDKPGVVREALLEADEVVFAGDGRPDFPAAVLVKPNNRFARRGSSLYKLLREAEMDFHAYDRWEEIADELIYRDVADAELSGPLKPMGEWFH